MQESDETFRIPDETVSSDEEVQGVAKVYESWRCSRNEEINSDEEPWRQSMGKIIWWSFMVVKFSQMIPGQRLGKSEKKLVSLPVKLLKDGKSD